MSNYKLLKEKLHNTKDIEIEEVNREEIEDIKNIKINDKLPVEERIAEFIYKTKNPYIIKVNGTLVKNTFGNKNIQIQECLNNIIKNNV